MGSRRSRPGSLRRGGDPVLCAPTPPVLPGAAEVVLGLIRENYRVLGRLLLTDAAWVEVKEKGENQGQRRGEKKTRWGGGHDTKDDERRKTSNPETAELLKTLPVGCGHTREGLGFDLWPRGVNRSPFRAGFLAGRTCPCLRSPVITSCLFGGGFPKKRSPVFYAADLA